MNRLALICCGALLAATSYAQERPQNMKPVENMKPVPNPQPVPNMEPIPNWEPVPSAQPGSNVKRNANTRPKRPTPTPDQCRSSASQIRTQYANTEDEDQKRALRGKLSDLANRCGGWGALSEGSSSPNPTSGAPKTGENSNNDSRGESGGGGGGGAGGKGAVPSPPPIRVIGGPTTTDTIILAPAPKATAGPFAKGFPTMLARNRAADLHLTEAWRRVSQPVAARQDTKLAATMKPPTLPEVADASEIAQNGLATARQLEREAAALSAFAVTRARYLGAKQSGDHAAMARQATLMEKFLAIASDAAHAAARSRAAADQLILAELEQRQAAAAKAGGWKQALPKLGSMTASDLPPEVRSELQSTGMAAQQIPLLLQDLNSLRPEKIDASIASLRAQVDAEKAAANGPQPPDLARLEVERMRVDALVDSAASLGQLK